MPLAGPGAPWGQPGPPARDGTAMGGVFAAELACQGRLLVTEDERDHGGGERAISEQHRPPQQQGLAQDGRDHREVHRVANVPVQTSHDQVGGRRDRRGRADALDHEPGEGVYEQGRARQHDQDAEHARAASARMRRRPPSGQPPGQQAGDGPGARAKKAALPVAATLLCMWPIVPSIPVPAESATRYGSCRPLTEATCPLASTSAQPLRAGVTGRQGDRPGPSRMTARI